MITAEHRFPAEFEKHRATWLLWPTRPDNWRADGYFAQHDTLTLAALISAFEPVRLGVPESDVAAVRRKVPQRVSVTALRFNDTWVRDTGPITLVARGKPSIAVDWKFNSWGGLFADASADDAVAGQIALHERFEVVRAPIVLEGGAVISDGRGTIITTEEAVLSADRNPGLTRSDAEEVFRRFLNVSNVIWLPRGLRHDEAGGHVDNVCAFAPGGLVLISATDDRSHPSYDRLREARSLLKQARSAMGRSYMIANVPLPPPTAISSVEARGFATPNGAIVRSEGTPLAPSHVNFYATRKAVFVPTFDTPSDHAALAVLGEAFPDRLIIPFASREFLLGGGAIHCLTKEIPS